jgi:hypothetical protein
MSFSQYESGLCFLVAFLVLVEFVGMVLLYILKKINPRSTKTIKPANKPVTVRELGRQGVAVEIERLRNGGRVDQVWLRAMSAEDRVLFEVALIEALAGRLTREQQRLRYVLIKQGYDELCSRRLMRGAICDHVRAAILLSLLRSNPRARLQKSIES